MPVIAIIMANIVAPEKLMQQRQKSHTLSQYGSSSLKAMSSDMALHLTACPAASPLTHHAIFKMAIWRTRRAFKFASFQICSTAQTAGQALGASKPADPEKIVKVTPPTWANTKVKVRAPGCSHARSHCLAR